jgi:hypothetical protein
MIARGDLAVEAGNERTAELQEEILWACEAAHLPVVWATQVLEDLAKTGRPSRAEVTDAAMATRAESVMLNRGPYVDRRRTSARRCRCCAASGRGARSGADGRRRSCAGVSIARRRGRDRPGGDPLA